MMRLVLDTNVVVSGMLWRGAPRRLLELARTGDIQLFTSPELLSEL
jgi:putative PIN family toxin of toxin-antitoxin system